MSSALAVEPQKPSIRIEPSTNGSIIYVHNPTSQPLTAVFLATAESPFWEEEFRDPVPAGGDRRIEFPHPGNATVQGAVYADGTWAADEQVRPRLVEERKLTLYSARELIKTIKNAQKQNTPVATVAGDLKIRADSLKDRPERWGSRQLMLDTVAQLEATRSYSDVLLGLLKEESNIGGGVG